MHPNEIFLMHLSASQGNLQMIFMPSSSRSVLESLLLVLIDFRCLFLPEIRSMILELDPAQSVKTRTVSDLSSLSNFVAKRSGESRGKEKEGDGKGMWKRSKKTTDKQYQYDSWLETNL